MSGGKAVAGEFFTLDRSTIEGLIERGFLTAAEQHDMDSVEKALQAFLCYEFRTKRGSTSSPAPPLNGRPLSRPVSTVVVSPQGRAALSELITDQLLLTLTNTGILPPQAGIELLNRVEQIAVDQKLYGGVVEGARFARDTLVYELRQLGLVSR
jgi:hypothetical protein